jgi:hypothetical protein
MRRFAIVMALSLVGVARADVKAPDPVPHRVARADLVFVGKVESVYGKAVELEWTPGDGSKHPFQVAKVKVTDPLLGKEKTVRVAFVPAQRKGWEHLNLKAGQEALFFLTKVDGQDAYRVRSYEDVVDKEKQAKGFAEAEDLARKCAKLLADPDAGLASKDKEERFLTAAMLVMRARTVPLAAPKRRAEVETDAGLSTKVLAALAEAEWGGEQYEFGRLTPRGVFTQLGLTEKDGWRYPGDPKQFGPEAQKWLKDNAGKYRLKRWAVRQGDDPEPRK